jgi:hypothetical protein
VQVNTMEGFWSLLRSWLRPHRGISQEKLPLSLGFFAFVHNMRKRGKALLGALMKLLVSEDPGIQKEPGPIAQHFRPRRHLLSTSAYRAEMGKRFESWADSTGTERAASRAGRTGERHLRA